jgi:ABC-type nitrate/sulfonate/bicarbonate transport system substrate-binding protein
MAEKLAAKEIDAFIAWEPFSSMALQQYGNFVAIHKYLSSSYLYISQSVVKRYPDAARHITAAQIRAMTKVTCLLDNLK